MSLAPHESSFRFTYGDYLHWTGDERWELIDGVLYEMTPAPAQRHQFILAALHLQIGNHFEGSGIRVCLSAFDVRLPDKNEADEKIRTVVQPDICVVCDSDKVDSHGVRGNPDWVIEILSPSTADKDKTVKTSLYERHGVREYWIVDWDAQAVTVYVRQPEGKFGPPNVTTTRGVQQVAIFPDLSIDWDRVSRNL